MAADSASNNEDNPYRSPQANDEAKEHIPADAEFPQNAYGALICQTVFPGAILAVMAALNRNYVAGVINYPIVLIVGTAWGGFGILLTLRVYALAAATRSKARESAGMILAVLFMVGSIWIVMLGPAVMRVQRPL
ncbi:MAG: hypothetical protein N2C14_11310, partial [Planctomycetales bacterium]